MIPMEDRHRQSTLTKRTLKRFGACEAAVLAGALSHFGTLAIVPFLMVGAGFLGTVPSEGALELSEFGTTEAYESFARPVRAFLPFVDAEMARDVRKLVREHAWDDFGGVLALLITASLFGWCLRRIHRRVLGTVDAGGFVAERVQVFVFLVAALALTGISSVFWHGLDLVVSDKARDSIFSTAILLLGFIVSVRWSGRGRLDLKSLAKGALLFCAGWQGAMWLFARYVESQNFYSTYGTLGGVACVMVWLYYASLVYVLALCMVAECVPEDGSKRKRDE